MENAKEIITIISSIVTILVTVTPLVIVLVKQIKNNIKQKNWLNVLNEMKDLIVFAEQTITTSGAVKKEYVMEKLNEYARENNIQIDEEELGKAIDALIDITKKVNV